VPPTSRFYNPFGPYHAPNRKLFFLGAMTRVDNILLNRNATEVSFQYIESLILDRIKDGSLLENTEGDSSEDLVDLLEGCLQRAGSGWVMVVADRVSHEVILGSLKQVKALEKDSFRFLDAVSRLVRSFPVLVLCYHTEIVRESLRLVKLSQTPSVAVARLAGAVISAKLPGSEVLHSLCTLSLYHLSAVNDSITGEAILELLFECRDYLSRDSQMGNTLLGLSQNLLSRFPENRELRRIGDLLFRRQENIPVVVMAGEEAVEAREVVLEDDMDEDLSPRSSCPSLEL